MNDFEKFLRDLKADGVFYTKQANPNGSISVYYNSGNTEDVFYHNGDHMITINYDVDGTAYAFNTHNLNETVVRNIEQAKTRDPMLEVLLDDEDTITTRDADDNYYCLYDGKVHVFSKDWEYMHTLKANDSKTYVIIGEKDGQIFWSYHKFHSEFIAAIDGSMLASYHYGLKDISVVDCSGQQITTR